MVGEAVRTNFQEKQAWPGLDSWGWEGDASWTFQQEDV